MWWRPSRSSTRDRGGRLLASLLAGLLPGLLLTAGLVASADPRATARDGPAVLRAPDPRERHLAKLRQLTFGGQNAEAYFSADGRRLIFQSTRDGRRCDQIYTMALDGSDLRLVSTGQGATTCGLFFPDRPRFLYASTHLGSPDCPPRPDPRQGYAWALHPAYDLFSANLDGSGLTRLTETPGYDAEGAVSPDGRHIVFTSMRDGDPEIYVMDADGRRPRRLTHAVGYDGGAFFSPDGTMIVYRAFHPRTEAERQAYAADLARNVFRPTWLEIFVMDADGRNQRQVTHLGAASFAPYLHLNGRQVIFASNAHDPRGRGFALYLVNLDGSGLERVTFAEGFASFPMFSPDGRTLVFTSTRHASAPREFNIFIADWRP
ncbi:MAG: PD40 domain-containing protein [Deltaproteobacteria bacterium]|nr:PD40 domain-containing protein [Deltaproteobacteria bacterium]